LYRNTKMENIYVDLLATNLENTTTTPGLFRYNSDASMGIIQDPSQYKLAIVRFQVDTASCALFMPGIIPRQDDINKTVYTVTLKQGNNYSTVNVIWRPQNLTANRPQSPANGLADYSTGYYDCNSYSWFCMLVLEALQTAATNLAIDGLLPPLFYWSNNAATIEAQTDFYDQASVAQPVGIWFNQPLFNLFNSFPSTLGQVNGEYMNRILCYKVASLNTDLIETAAGQDEFITVTQEYSTVLAWSPYTSIVFTSSSLPVGSSVVLPPQVTINGDIDYSTSQLSSQEAIITDLVTEDGTYRSSITYAPSLLRFVDLQGTLEIKNIAVNVYMRTKLGSLIPFKLNSGGSLSMKLGFFKK
jgi:hypothetical protein